MRKPVLREIIGMCIKDKATLGAGTDRKASGILMPFDIMTL